MKTSLVSSRRRTARLPFSLFMSQEAERLPRLSRRYTGPISGVFGGVPTLRIAVAFRRLDLDDVGAEIGENLRAVRSENHCRHVGDADTGQRKLPCHFLSPNSALLVGRARSHAASGRAANATAEYGIGLPGVSAGA